ncbi:MAG: hypothetical protein WC415_02340 [Patescibacteria group bacterium]|jgi:hypothetical protein
MPFFTANSLRKSLVGKVLSASLKKNLSVAGANQGKTVHFLVEKLTGKNEDDRKKIYSKLGLSVYGRKEVEGKINEGVKAFSGAEKARIKREANEKKRMNVRLSHVFSEDSGSSYGSSLGRFAGGVTQRRSRVGASASARITNPSIKKDETGIFSKSSDPKNNKDEKIKKGFAEQTKDREKNNHSSNPPARPIGLGSL